LKTEEESEKAMRKNNLIFICGLLFISLPAQTQNKSLEIVSPKRQAILLEVQNSPAQKKITILSSTSRHEKSRDSQMELTSSPPSERSRSLSPLSDEKRELKSQQDNRSKLGSGGWLPDQNQLSTNRNLIRQINWYVRMADSCQRADLIELLQESDLSLSQDITLDAANLSEDAQRCLATGI
jgi:hypothetical protein